MSSSIYSRLAEALKSRLAIYRSSGAVAARGEMVDVAHPSGPRGRQDANRR